MINTVTKLQYFAHESEQYLSDMKVLFMLTLKLKGLSMVGEEGAGNDLHFV